jgi:hypothetical protein
MGTGAIVAHRQLQRSPHGARTDRHPSPGDAWGDGVHQRVLDERLQDKGRDFRLEQGLVNGPAHREAFAEPHLLDLEIASCEVEFVAERKRGVLGGRQGGAQQLREPHRHALGGGGILAHQRHDRIEGVEQEVRMQLRAERGELGLRQVAGEPGRAQRLRTPGVVPAHRGVRAHDGPVDDQKEVAVGAQPVRQDAVEGPRRGRRRPIGSRSRQSGSAP